jgi:hypothetical protein
MFLLFLSKLDYQTFTYQLLEFYDKTDRIDFFRQNLLTQTRFIILKITFVGIYVLFSVAFLWKGKAINEYLILYKNRIFQRNFTHPLNYVCLLHDPFLKKVLDYHANPDLNKLFGYDIEDKEKLLDRNLSDLKINLAHYGGSENWDEFLKKDRYDEANAIIRYPSKGLDLTNRLNNNTILHSMWHYVDWFSIISSMILSFENVYTDISYTVHDIKYLNLLSEIMDNNKIGERILFGTDFYVVSNHKSEKQYWIDMQNTLGTEKWNKLARTNPKTFLNL